MPCAVIVCTSSLFGNEGNKEDRSRAVHFEDTMDVIEFVVVCRRRRTIGICAAIGIEDEDAVVCKAGAGKGADGGGDNTTTNFPR